MQDPIPQVLFFGIFQTDVPFSPFRFEIFRTEKHHQLQLKWQIQILERRLACNQVLLKKKLGLLCNLTVLSYKRVSSCIINKHHNTTMHYKTVWMIFMCVAMNLLVEWWLIIAWKGRQLTINGRTQWLIPPDMTFQESALQNPRIRDLVAQIVIN